MQTYLFVHFREKTTPNGVQVYFAISRDQATGHFCIFATDLSLGYGMCGKCHHSWRNINLHGSKDLAHWWSDDLVPGLSR